MFREMRRIRQQLPQEEVLAVLERNTNGVLGVIAEEGYPYTVPLSYVYMNGRLYFHSAKEGQKIDAIRQNPKVSFTIIDEDTVVGEQYTTYYRSVTVFGTAYIADDEAERLGALRALAEKYSGSLPEAEREKTVRGCSKACIIGIQAEHMTGKEAMEYVRKKEEQQN